MRTNAHYERNTIRPLVEKTKQTARNWMAIILSYRASMGTDGTAALTIGDVFDSDNRTVQSQIRLSSDIIRCDRARVVLVSNRPRKKSDRHRDRLGKNLKPERPRRRHRSRRNFRERALPVSVRAEKKSMPQKVPPPAHKKKRAATPVARGRRAAKAGRLRSGREATRPAGEA